jgi:hypothetical protein
MLRKLTRRLLRLFLGSVSLYVLGAVVGANTFSDTDWRDLTSADLPARLDGIVFPGGNVLSHTHTLVWGRWTVMLTDKTNAYFGQVGSPNLKVIGINSLVCSNDVAGKANCSMRFDRLDGDWTCNIFIERYDSIQIGCPSDLRLR